MKEPEFDPTKPVRDIATYKGQPLSARDVYDMMASIYFVPNSKFGPQFLADRPDTWVGMMFGQPLVRTVSYREFLEALKPYFEHAWQQLAEFVEKEIPGEMEHIRACLKDKSKTR